MDTVICALTFIKYVFRFPSRPRWESQYNIHAANRDTSQSEPMDLRCSSFFVKMCKMVHNEHECSHTALQCPRSLSCSLFFLLLSDIILFDKMLQLICLDSRSIIQVRKPPKVDSVHLNAAFENVVENTHQ